MDKHKLTEDPVGGHDNSYVLSLREYLVDYPSVQQYVTTEQLREALRQIQEAVIQGICKTKKAPEHQPRIIWRLECKPTPRYTPRYQKNRNRPRTQLTDIKRIEIVL